ncbi:MAG TPA: hypothetical protein VKB93_22425, partial [Thermoanaerobaculia bacterium]|nr:hypothetical protein [Thermoanaerobaculia bacterium]
PDVPLLRVPWNALAVVAGLVAGWWDPALWGATAAGEFIYLLTMASNPGFQKHIDERRVVELRGDTEEARRKLLSNVGGAARQRYRKLEEKRERLHALYIQHAGDDLFLDSNREALRKLTWLFLNLLVAQRNFIIAPKSDERDLQKQIGTLEREMTVPDLTQSLRESKQATLDLLRGRLDNIDHRDSSLAEIDADLARIEAQFDLALEEATLRGRPAAISIGVELTSRMLNIEDQVVESSSHRVAE